MGFIVLLAVVTVSAAVLSGVVRRYAVKRQIVDVPNARSSHAVPTPRGGGLAIVLGFLVGLLLLVAVEGADVYLFAAVLGAGSVTAAVGFIDDHRHVPARWRLLLHFLAAAWVVVWIPNLPPLELLGYSLDSGWLSIFAAVLFLVWLLNLYNFMDGIDGIASVEAVSVCVGAAVVHSVAGEAPSVAAPLLLAAAVAGFLYWNFPPAKIFMGDVGSGFLGITLGILSLHAGSVAPALFWSWLILLGVFIVDATWTLLRRLIRGERIYEAHRSHAYQHAAQLLGAHRPVTLGVAVINLLWLLPVAVAVGTRALDPLTGLVIAYTPLLALAVRFRAGLPHASQNV